MAKKSQKRRVQFEKDHSGCIWGLVSIFDFRNGRTARKLITDRRHGTKHDGTGHTKNRFEVLGNLDENRQETHDCKETSVSVGGVAKPSVKELLEVEMVGEQQINEINNGDLKSKESNSVDEGQKKKRRRKRTKSSGKSSNISIEDSGAPKNMGSESSCIQVSGKQSMKDLNVDDMMEEFCRQIHQKGISCQEHEQISRVKFDEEIREFINQKVLDNKEMTGDENMQELIDIFRILSLDEELFLKLIQNPNSPLVKQTRSWRDTRNGESDSLGVLHLSENKSGKPEELINNKHRNFFKRMVKSKERGLLTEKADVNASKKIVILKPGPTGSQSSEIDKNLGSSSESHNVVRSKGSIKKGSSYFSFTKIRGKLRNAIGKEGTDMSTGSAENGYGSERPKIEDSDKTNSSNNIGKSSPGKDHFFIERYAKPSTSLKRGSRNSKAKDSDMTNERGTSGNSGRKVSNVYIEARRRLSEMLSTGEGNAESSSRRVPRTLGRILSLPEYNLSPINSPKVNLAYKCDITAIGCSGNDKDQMVNKDTGSLKEENDECRPELTTCLEIKISADDHDSKLQTKDPTPNLKNELTCNSTVDTSCPLTDELDPEGDMDIPKETADVSIEDGTSSDASCQPSNTCTRHGKNDDLIEVQESYEPNQMQSPESPPPSRLWRNEKEIATCTLERPSPVSVLEPLFMQDEASPERIICNGESELPVQPLCIRFEECESSPPAPQGTHPENFQDEETIIEYVTAVLQASGLKWDELYMGSFSSGHLLESSLFDKLELFNELHIEKKLLFDIINEVLTEVYERYFSFSLWVAFIKPGIRPPPSAKNVTNEVCKSVFWHLIHLPQPCSMDHIVRKDMSRSDSWLDFRSDAENIGFGMGEVILDELLDETILSCLHESPGENPALSLGSSEVES